MSDRNLTTSRSQVFGDVETGTECRVCGRAVEDGRSKHCSRYCERIVSAVMGLLNWSSVRRHIINRDDETCQRCGWNYARERRARRHIRQRIEDRLPDRPENPGMLQVAEGDIEFDWSEHNNRSRQRSVAKEYLIEQYGDPYERARDLEVDHITPVSEGGHPFDPANLQTLCSECHQSKTAEENRKRAEHQTPSREDLNESLFQYVADGGDSA